MGTEVYEPYVISNKLKELFEQRIREYHLEHDHSRDDVEIEEEACEEFEKFLYFMIDYYYRMKK